MDVLNHANLVAIEKRFNIAHAMFSCKVFGEYHLLQKGKYFDEVSFIKLNIENSSA